MKCCYKCIKEQHIGYIDRKVWRSFSRFWAYRPGLSIFLVMIVVVVFVLPPLGSLGIIGRFIFDIFFSLLS